MSIWKDVKKKKKDLLKKKKSRGVIILVSTDERPEELIMSVEGGSYTFLFRLFTFTWRPDSLQTPC